MYNVEIDLCLNLGATWPKYTTNISKQKILSQDNNSMIVKHVGVVTSNVNLHYVEKPQSETVVKDEQIVRDQCIEIRNIWINGIKIPLHMIDRISEFVPNYRQDFLEYCKREKIVVDHGPLHVTTFWHAGTWTLPVTENFWVDYNRARQYHNNTNYTGVSSKDIQENLKRLKLFL